MQIDADRLIDERPVSALQKRVFVFCGLVAVLDAVDSVAISFAGPLIREQFAMSPAAFQPAFSAGLFGAAIGAIAAGPLSDRVGRKPMLVFTTALFGLFTCLSPFADSFTVFFLYRLIAGLGLGGATPCFITMAAEYAPQRSRATLVSFLWAGYPLGNSLGGFVASYLIAKLPWSWVFYAGGIPTLLLAAGILLGLPESLRFAAARGDTRTAVRIARRLDPGLPPDAQILAKTRPPRARIPIADLFLDGRMAGSFLLGLALFFGFATTTVLVLQIPTLLRLGADIPLSASASLVASYSLVATIGMAIAGKLVERFGIVRALAMPFIGGALLILGVSALVVSSLIAARVFMFLLGLTVSVGASGVIALAATFYPTAMRSAGTGWVMCMGRLGQVCSPLIIGALLAAAWPPLRILAAMAFLPLFAALCMVLLAGLMAGRARAAKAQNPAAPLPVKESA